MYEIYRFIRDSKGLKDTDVCRLTGISQSTLSDWKKGRIKQLKADKLQRIADALEVSIDYLMTGEETPKESADGKVYYFDDATAQAAQDMFDNKDLHALMDAARGSDPENIRLATEMLLRFKGTNPDG